MVANNCTATSCGNIISISGLKLEIHQGQKRPRSLHSRSPTNDAFPLSTSLSIRLVPETGSEIVIGITAVCQRRVNQIRQNRLKNSCCCRCSRCGGCRCCGGGSCGGCSSCCRCWLDSSIFPSAALSITFESVHTNASCIAVPCLYTVSIHITLGAFAVLLVFPFFSPFKVRRSVIKFVVIKLGHGRVR